MFNSKQNNEKLLKVFSGIRCLNKDQLPRYLDGRLTEVEKHLVEQHLADCDLCFEALQALEQDNNADKYQELTGQLQRYIHQSIEPVSQVQKIAQYTRKERKKESLLVYFWLLAFAVLGVSSIYVLRGHMRNQPAPRIMAAAARQKQDSTDTLATAQQPIVTPVPDNQTTSPRNTHTGVTANTTKPADAAKVPATPVAPVVRNTADSIAKAKAAALKAQQRRATTDSIRRANLQRQQDSVRKATEKKEAEKKEEKKPEPKQDPKPEVKDPPAEPKKDPGTEPVNSDEYLYKAAMVYQQQGNLNEAIDRYKRITSISSGKYAEMARYQLAICYRSKGQMGKARRMFREVIRMEGSMKNAAQQALDSM
ncbi:MAG TPA: tetratricopeptide repeat protein [Chitinophaga sp.]|uniref:tetratricopeptide repeat protein n=1 Tax=Chitinophaga sp. TaxID=1869181 RepID=UPI002BD89D1C|nr:tetratricopeptide repeat protein [Chitinophaga sp.]HVI48370.1 tetratricopeptide repeat protein [Chitinophaga sp.]